MLYNNTKYRKLLKEELISAYKEKLYEKTLHKIRWVVRDINRKDFQNYKSLGFSDIFNVKRVSNKRKKLSNLSVQEYMEKLKEFSDQHNWKEKDIFKSSNILFIGPNYKKKPFYSLDIFVLPKSESKDFENGFAGKQLLGNVSGANIYEAENYFDWIKIVVDKAETFDADVRKRKGMSKDQKDQMKQNIKNDKAMAAALTNAKAVKQISKNNKKNKILDRTIPQEIETTGAGEGAEVPVENGEEASTETSVTISKRKRMPGKFRTGFNKKAGDAYRKWANSTAELKAVYGKTSEFDLDDASPNMKPDNSFIRKSLYAAMQDYENEEGELSAENVNNRKKFEKIIELYNANTAATDNQQTSSGDTGDTGDDGATGDTGDDGATGDTVTDSDDFSDNTPDPNNEYSDRW